VTYLPNNVLPHGPKRPRYLELLALIVASIALWWRTLAATLDLALASDAHTHILLILPLSVALIYFRAKERPSISTSRRWVGAILLIAALTFHGLTAWKILHLSSGDSLSLSMFALVTLWIGSVILCMGVRTLRSFLFPLCFLLLVVPLPENVLSWITELLQHQSARAASALFYLAGVPVTRVGIMLSIPRLDIEVARECSSIRSSMILIVTTMVMAHLFLQSWWRKTLLIAVAIPLSVAKNALRIFSIAELGTRVDPGFLDGRLHHNGGIVFFSLAIFAEVIVLWLFRRRELRTSTMNEEPANQQANGTKQPSRVEDRNRKARIRVPHSGAG
jgi:exosortase